MTSYQIHKPQPTPFIIGLDGYKNKAVVKHLLPPMVVALDTGVVKIVNKESACIVISKRPIIFHEELTVQARELQVTFGEQEYYMLMLLGSGKDNCEDYLEVIDLDLMHGHATAPKAGNLVESFIEQTNKKPWPTPLAEIFASSYTKEMGAPFVVGYVSRQMYGSAFHAPDTSECLGWLIHSTFDVWSPDLDANLGEMIYDITGYCSCGTPPDSLSEVFEITLMNYAMGEKGYLTGAAWKKLQEHYGEHCVDFALAILDDLGLTEHGYSMPGHLSDMGKFFVKYFKPGQFEALDPNDPIYKPEH